MTLTFDEAEALLADLCRPLLNYVCPLYVIRRRQGYLIGSGILIDAGYARLIATATHVLEEAGRELVWTTGTELPFQLTGERRGYRYKPGYVDVDVSVIVLNDLEWAELTRRYSVTSLRDFGDVASPASVAFYVLTGYPHSKNKPTPRSKHELNETAMYVLSNTLLRVSNAGTGIDPEVHYALQLHTEGGAHRRPNWFPKLQGMSGGGVWRFQGSAGVPEDAVPQLIGIGIQHDLKQHAVVFTDIRKVLQVVSDLEFS